MDFIWPIITSIFVIFMLKFILDKKKIDLYIFLTMAVVSLMHALIFKVDFKEIYIFLFLLSIGLIILSLKKDIDFFTLIAIGLMLMMLGILFKYPLL